MSARTIKNPATVSGKGELSSESVVLTNDVDCVLSSSDAGDLLVNGEPLSSTSKMFAYTFIAPSVPINSGSSSTFNILISPNIVYNSSEIYTCMVLPIYTAGSQPITITGCQWLNNGSGLGSIRLNFINNSTSASTITTIICYGFLNV